MTRELETWIDEQRAHGAASVAIRPARGGEDIARVDLASAGADEVLDACRDSLRARRMTAGAFRLRAAGDTYARSKTVKVSLDDDDGGQVVTDADPTLVGVCKAQAAMIDSLSRTMVELAQNAKGTTEDLREVVRDLSGRLIEQEGKTAEVLAGAYELASLRRELAQDAAQAQLRTETMHTAVRELSPVVGAIASHWSKRSGPAVAALLGSLTEDQQGKLLELLDGSQRAALGAILGAGKDGTP